MAALLTTPASALIASAVVFAAFALLVTTGVQTSRENRGRIDPDADADWRRVIDHTLVGTVGGIAALGLLQVSPAAAVVAALGLGAAGTWAFSWHRDAVPQSPEAGYAAPRAGGTGPAPRASLPRLPRPEKAPQEVPPEVAAPASTPDVKALTTTDLVLAWRRSYAQLTGMRSPSQLAELAARRQQLLDELERRDRTGVERWLRSGARAASDPSRFLQRPTDPSATSA